MDDIFLDLADIESVDENLYPIDIEIGIETGEPAVVPDRGGQTAANQAVGDILEDVIESATSGSSHTPVYDAFTASLTNEQIQTIQQHRDDRMDTANTAAAPLQNIQTAAALLDVANVHNGGQPTVTEVRHENQVVAQQTIPDADMELQHLESIAAVHPALRNAPYPDTEEAVTQSSAAIAPTAAGSSSMHEQQARAAATHSNALLTGPVQSVPDINLLSRLNEAVELFYTIVYRKFEIRRRRLTTASGLGCREDNIPQGLQNELILKREDVVSWIRNEIERGLVPTEAVMTAYVTSLFQSKKYQNVCPSCDTLFVHQPTFQLHLIHVDSGKIRCPYVCGQELISMSTVLLHMRRSHKLGDGDTGEQVSFPCDIPGCHRTFRTIRGLSSHKKQAHDDGQRQCNICKMRMEQSLLSAHYLSSHGSTHGIEDRYPCTTSGCNVRCRTGRALQFHMAQVHGVFQGHYAAYKRCPHPGCNQIFSSERRAELHRRRHH